MYILFVREDVGGDPLRCPEDESSQQEIYILEDRKIP